MHPAMRNLAFVFFMFVSTVLLPKDIWAENILVFGGVSDIPPMSFKENGVAAGFLPDLFHEIALYFDDCLFV